MCVVRTNVVRLELAQLWSQHTLYVAKSQKPTKHINQPFIWKCFLTVLAGLSLLFFSSLLLYFDQFWLAESNKFSRYGCKCSNFPHISTHPYKMLQFASSYPMKVLSSIFRLLPVTTCCCCSSSIILKMNIVQLGRMSFPQTTVRQPDVWMCVRLAITEFSCFKVAIKTIYQKLA